MDQDDMDSYLEEQLKDPLFALQYEIACRDWDWVSPRPLNRNIEEKHRNDN